MATMPGRPVASTSAGVLRIGNVRWTICGLLFLAATINYIDRQVIGILKPTLQAEFGWSEIDYADIVFAKDVLVELCRDTACRSCPIRTSMTCGVRSSRPANCRARSLHYAARDGRRPPT